MNHSILKTIFYLLDLPAILPERLRIRIATAQPGSVLEHAEIRLAPVQCEATPSRPEISGNFVDCKFL